MHLLLIRPNVECSLCHTNRMFETYINELRLLRRNALDLEPATFRHVQTIRDPHNKLATDSGWALWTAGEYLESVAIAWPWGLIQHGIPAIDPLQIQSNLLLLDTVGHPLPEYQGLATLVYLVNRLAWHSHALQACGKPLS